MRGLPALGPHERADGPEVMASLTNNSTEVLLKSLWKTFGNIKDTTAFFFFDSCFSTHL